jgi:hypothetical protein
MSINNIIENRPKPWLNSCVKNLTVEDRLTYKEDLKIDGAYLDLISIDGALVANWLVPPVLPRVYNNQCDLIIRGEEFVTIERPVTFINFKYAAPGYYNLTPDKKALLISSPGRYYVLFQGGTFTTTASANFQIFLNGIVIDSSICSFIPARLPPTTSTDQLTICCGSCFISVTSLSEIELKITPTSDFVLDSASSTLTVIKLTNFD